MYNTYLSSRNSSRSSFFPDSMLLGCYNSEYLLTRVVETPLKKEKKAAPRILFNHVSSSAFLS